MITNEAVNQAIKYILEHIGEDITAAEVAAHCHFSRYYFSRIFRMETGEGIYEYMKRVKLEQSAFRLKTEPDRSISAIGADYGYSPSNYSSAFKRHHDMSPARFRRNIIHNSMMNPIYGDAKTRLESFEECSAKITVETRRDCPVIYERRIGNYGNLSADWCAFMEKYKVFITDQTIFLERTYDDPSITGSSDCLYDICMSAPEGCTLKNLDTIKGGKFAVYRFSGNVKRIYSAYQSIFNIWLPQSGYHIDDRYGFEVYQKIDAAAMNMEIEFCIPVK